MDRLAIPVAFQLGDPFALLGDIGFVALARVKNFSDKYASDLQAKEAGAVRRQTPAVCRVKPGNRDQTPRYLQKANSPGRSATIRPSCTAWSADCRRKSKSNRWHLR